MQKYSLLYRLIMTVLAVWLGSFWLLPMIPVEWENEIFSPVSSVKTIYMFGILFIYFLFLYKMSIHVVSSKDLSPRLRLMLILGNVTGFGAVVYFFSRYIRNPAGSMIETANPNVSDGA